MSWKRKAADYAQYTVDIACVGVAVCDLDTCKPPPYHNVLLDGHDRYGLV